MKEPYDNSVRGKWGVTEKRLVAACICLAAAGGLTMLAGTVDGFAGWYAETVYPVPVFLAVHLTGRIPFSLSEAGLYILIPGVVVTAVRTWICGKKSGNYGQEVLRWSSGLFLTAAILFFLYVVNCGVNYHRSSFSEKEGMYPEPYSAEELGEVCNWLTEEVNARADEVSRDAQGLLTLDRQKEAQAVQAMKGLAEQYESMKGGYPLPKKLMVSELLSYQSLTGVYSPFTVEANYNGDMTACNIPFTMCHELSHLRGFMQEEEANFIAFLACSGAEEVEFQYSGYLMAWLYSANALYRMDQTLWMEMRARLDQAAEADLTANSQFWDSYEGVVSEIADKVNDTYLKVNGQVDGVKSYDRMVDLLVVYYQDNEKEKC